MVKVIQKNNKELYRCEEGGFHYANKELAGKCEARPTPNFGVGAWCREHKS